MIFILFITPFVFIKEIVLSDKVYIKRFIYPGYQFEYSDIQWSSLSLIKVKYRGKSISLKDITNREIFCELLDRHMRASGNRNLEINEEVVVNEIRVNFALIISILVTFVITAVIGIMNVLPKNWSIQVVTFIIWLIVFLSVYYINKYINRNKN